MFSEILTDIIPGHECIVVLFMCCRFHNILCADIQSFNIVLWVVGLP